MKLSQSQALAFAVGVTIAIVTAIPSNREKDRRLLLLEKRVGELEEIAYHPAINKLICSTDEYLRPVREALEKIGYTNKVVSQNLLFTTPTNFWIER